MHHKDLTDQSLVQAELKALQEEGYEVQPLKKWNQHTRLSDFEIDEFWREANSLTGKQIVNNEPSDYDGILAARNKNNNYHLPKPREEEMQDRILGAWLGRCAGCTLGKPVEGWPRQKIKEYLQAAGTYPLEGYIPAMSPFLPGLELHQNYVGTTKGNIIKMVRDDDIDYTIIGLKALETYGLDFTAKDIGRLWLENLPFYNIFTAEAAAYRNMVNQLEPPQSACYRNPYREFIGAQIRADMWGYIHPGDPERAAAMAYRDATISHTKNGIYGEMWAAACIAAAFVLDDPAEIIKAGLSEIPCDSRLFKAIQNTLVWAQNMKNWEDVYRMIETHFGHYHTVHVINNSCLIAAGLMIGRGDFSQTLCSTLMGGLDTDCTCATNGSIAGAMLGAKQLPQDWVDPFNNGLESLVHGFENSRISDLAQRTCSFIV